TDVNTLEAGIRRAVAAASGGRSETPPEPTRGPARPGDLRSTMVDPGLARAILGWQPTMPLAAGLAETVDWFAARVRPQA
ncbi:MAG: UDP-glucose 4-epimerase, partial [Planctomycetia bacterium]